MHTTTPELGLVISNFADDTRSGVWKLERELSNLIHGYLIDLVKPQTWSDLSFIAVAKGPGGFTGTRIGIVAARTFGQQLDIPVFAISTLAAIAWKTFTEEYHSSQVLRSPDEVRVGDVNTKSSLPIAVQMRAQRGQVFGSIYKPHADKSGLEVLFPDTVLQPEVWQEKLDNWNSEYQLVEAKSDLAASVNHILDLAYMEWQQGKSPHWSDALPFYGQHPVN
ncbi:MAG: tRNA (adenosine(37)-N6)-threonylcarbamoyltransferase complex dimerization subunit type 1 TsaB [Mastigocoleus sp.]